MATAPFADTDTGVTSFGPESADGTELAAYPRRPAPEQVDRVTVAEVLRVLDHPAEVVNGVRHLRPLRPTAYGDDIGGE